MAFASDLNPSRSHSEFPDSLLLNVTRNISEQDAFLWHSAAWTVASKHLCLIQQLWSLTPLRVASLFSSFVSAAPGLLSCAGLRLCPSLRGMLLSHVLLLEIHPPSLLLLLGSSEINYHEHQVRNASSHGGIPPWQKWLSNSKFTAASIWWL